MAGDTNGTEEALAAQDVQAADDTREKQAKVGDDGHGAAGSADYERAIGERNARIAELEAQGENYRIDFRLRLAGARNLKAAHAVLTDHDSDVEALAAAESWLFSQTGCTSQETSQNISGATGMESVGVAGGTAEHDMRR